MKTIIVWITAWLLLDMIYSIIVGNGVWPIFALMLIVELMIFTIYLIMVISATEEKYRGEFP